jgi:3-hydroxyacyl-[acyl-carrier-protein] dehydratase
MAEDAEGIGAAGERGVSGLSLEEIRRLDHEWIRSILPHRYPLLLVDRVLEMVPDKTIVALKNVTQNEEFFQGHFPGKPIMPGVLVIEALAQAAGLLLLYTRPELHGRVIYFVGIENAKFRNPVTPGDQLHLHVEILRARRNHAKFACRATIGGLVAVECTASSMIGRDER